MRLDAADLALIEIDNDTRVHSCVVVKLMSHIKHLDRDLRHAHQQLVSVCTRCDELEEELDELSDV